jgi:hypothetical protein
MTEKEHIPLGVGFYPDWFYQQYGISFGRKYYFDPETRVEARMEIDKSFTKGLVTLDWAMPTQNPNRL